MLVNQTEVENHVARFGINYNLHFEVHSRILYHAKLFAAISAFAFCCFDVLSNSVVGVKR